jgi:aspartate aminotransferase-like enzyme
MGNLSSAQVRFAIEAVEKTLLGLGRRLKPGSGIAAVNKVLTA